MPWLDTLTLQQFRLFNQATFTFDSPIVSITGPNGSGKSTVLEAICLLSQARSYRTNRERDLIQFGHAEARLELTLNNGTNLVEPTRLTARLAVTPDDRLVTRFTRNDVTLRTRSAVIGHCPTVSFFLSDLDIARDNAEARRRWLDTAVAQCHPQHWRHLSDYDKVRRQKNQLLKTPEAPGYAEQLHLWNDQLIRYAVPILQARWQYIQALQPLAQAAYHALAPGLETLTMRYVPRWLESAESFLYDGEPDWQTVLHQAQHRLFKAEQARAISLVGPHRDDVFLWLDNHLVCEFGSQGQQRSVVLALKHAEWQHLVQHLNDWPVLLLDDVMAELDPQRQQFLLQWFTPQAQVILTTTHLNGLLPQTVQMIDLPLLSIPVPT
jgi:DNA replication and repair protein RecF